MSTPEIRKISISVFFYLQKEKKSLIWSYDFSWPCKHSPMSKKYLHSLDHKLQQELPLKWIHIFTLKTSSNILGKYTTSGLTTVSTGLKAPYSSKVDIFYPRKGVIN